MMKRNKRHKQLKLSNFCCLEKERCKKNIETMFLATVRHVNIFRKSTRKQKQILKMKENSIDGSLATLPDKLNSVGPGLKYKN